MRKYLLASFFLILHAYLHGQLIKEATYNYSVGTTMLNRTTWKFYLMDVPLSQCRIYNMDHSLYKIINCPVPPNNYLYDIKFVSENLFNTDDKIELFYSYYEWVTTTGTGSTTSGYYRYGAKIIDETGTVLNDIPGGLFAYLFKTAENQSKLFVYCYDNSVTPYKIWTNIYKLSGDTSTIIIFQENQLKNMMAAETAYPNPAINNITIPYSIPENLSTATIKTYNMNGIMIESFIVDKTFNHLILDLSHYLPGSYTYQIEAGGMLIKSDIFEVIK